MPDAVASIADNFFMVVIQDFQDPYTLNVKQLMKCCVEQITPDGRLIPFCAYNSVGYREQVREQLSGVPIPTLVPNAHELQPVLLTTKYGSKTTAAKTGPQRRVARRTRGTADSDPRRTAVPAKTSRRAARPRINTMQWRCCSASTTTRAGRRSRDASPTRSASRLEAGCSTSPADPAPLRCCWPTSSP